MRLLLHSIIAPLALILACKTYQGDTELSEARGRRNTVSSEKLVVDLAKFSSAAKAKIDSQFSPRKLQGEGQLWFQQGISSADMSPVFDQTMLMYLMPLPEDLSPEKGLYYFHGAILQGKEISGFAHFHRKNGALNGSVEHIAPMESGLHYSFSMQLKPNEIERIYNSTIKPFLNRENVISESFLSAIGIGTIEATPAKLVGIAANLRKIRGIEEVRVDRLNFRMPFEFSTPEKLLTSGKIDLLPKLMMRRKFERDGFQFTTLPSLPSAFGGKGERPNPAVEQKPEGPTHQLSLKIGVNLSDCYKEIQAIKGVTILNSDLARVSGFFELIVSNAAAAVELKANKLCVDNLSSVNEEEPTNGVYSAGSRRMTLDQYLRLKYARDGAWKK